MRDRSSVVVVPGAPLEDGSGGAVVSPSPRTWGPPQAPAVVDEPVPPRPGAPLRRTAAGTTRWTWLALVGAVALVVAGVLLLRDASARRDEAARLDDRRTDVIETDIDRSATRLEAARLELADLQAEVATADEDLARLRDELAVQNDRLAAADATVGPVADAVVALQLDLLAVADTVQAAQDAFDAVTATVDTAVGQGNARDVAAMVTTLDAVPASVADLQAIFDDAATQLDALRAGIDGLPLVADQEAVSGES